jgi:hypothetical protein
MRKILAGGALFALVLGITACGRGEPLEVYENGTQMHEIVEYEPLMQFPDPTEIEDEPTHAILESRLGITLEYPADWRFRDDGNLHIFPQGRPYRATWYDRTVFEVTFDRLDSDRLSHVDPVEWLEFHLNSDFAEPIIIDGVQAFLLWDITENQINRTMQPYARTARYAFIKNDKLYEINLRSGDGCLDEWAIMQDIFESIRFQA